MVKVPKQTSRQIAHHFQVGIRRVQQLAKDGMPVYSRSPYQFSAYACEQWILADKSRSPAIYATLKGRGLTLRAKASAPEQPRQEPFQAMADSEPSLAQPERFQVTLEQLTLIAQQASQRTAKEVRDQTLEQTAKAASENQTDFRDMVKGILEELLTDPKVLDRISKHAIHLSDIKWRETFKLLGETPVYDEHDQSRPEKGRKR